MLTILASVAKLFPWLQSRSSNLDVSTLAKNSLDQSNFMFKSDWLNKLLFKISKEFFSSIHLIFKQRIK